DGHSSPRQRVPVAVSSPHSPRRPAASPDGGQRRPHNGQRLRSSSAPARPPDLGALAREAVVGFLHDASMATAQRAATRAEGTPAVAAATATPTGSAVTGSAVTGSAVTGSAVTGSAGEIARHSVAESTGARGATPPPPRPGGGGGGGPQP